MYISNGTIKGDRLSTARSLITESTGLKWTPESVIEPVNAFLEAWEEPSTPLHPIYDPYNYGILQTGKIPHSAFASVPFIVALGGLSSLREPVSSKQFQEIVRVFIDSSRSDIAVEQNEREKIAAQATKRALRVIESLGVTSLLSKNNHARSTIKESFAFDRRTTKNILNP